MTTVDCPSCYGRPVGECPDCGTRRPVRHVVLILDHAVVDKLDRLAQAPTDPGAMPIEVIQSRSRYLTTLITEVEA